jgi:hypothetical protein
MDLWTSETPIWTKEIPGFADMFFGNLETADKHFLWQKRREMILQKAVNIIGFTPEAAAGVDFEVEYEKNISPIVSLRKLNFASNEGDRVSAYLLVPIQARSEKLPAVLAMHPTVPWAKEEVVGLDGDRERAYGLELAEKGFIVLVPDILSAGERTFPGLGPYETAPFYERYPEWSMMGKMISDHMRCTDLLCSLDDVDSEKIAVIGHSLGGYNAYFHAAFDLRIKAIVCSCGFGTFYGEPRPYRWGTRVKGFTHFPKITEMLNRGEVPFEFTEIVALSFPRPFFNWSTQSDIYFPHWEEIGKAIKTVSELYNSFSLENRFVSLIGTGKHEFPRAIRNMSYEWIKEQLYSPHG